MSRGLGILIAVAVILIIIAFAATEMVNRNRSDTADTQNNSPAQNTSGEREATEEYVVTIKNFSFNPANIEIEKGEEVTFKNEDTVAHTATADDNSFDTGLLSQNQQVKIRFENAGTFSYHCTPHPYMKGTIVVK